MDCPVSLKSVKPYLDRASEVQAKDPITGALLFRTVQTSAGASVQEPVMELKQAV